MEFVSGGNHSSCAVFGNDRRAAVNLARLEGLSGQNKSLVPRAGEPDLSRRFFQLACLAFDFQPGQLLTGCYPPTQTHGYDFHFALRAAVPVAAFVLGMKTLDHVLAKSQIQLISLSAITQVTALLKYHSSLPAFLIEFSA